MRRLSLVLAASVLAAAVMFSAGSHFFGRTAAAQGPAVGASDATAQAGGGGSVEIFARDFDPPGLGAWTIDVSYDPSVITASGCVALAHVSVCNQHYSSDTVRSAGANARGIAGDTALARIDFTCLRAGTTTLRVLPRDVSDATIGGPVLLDVATVDGTVLCEAGATPAVQPPSVPDAGSGGGGQDSLWRVVSLLALLASAAVVFAAGVRVFARRGD